MKHAIQAGVAALFFVSNAHAGIYMEMSRQDFETGKITVRDATFLQGGKMRTESQDGGQITIFKDGTVTQLDRAKKTYRVIDKAAMGEMAGQMNDAFAKLNEKMAKMPPEQRAQMEKMMSQMGGRPGSPAAPKTRVTDVVDLGSSGSAGGRSCRLWNRTVDGVPDEQYCIVTKGSLPGADEAMKTFKAMGDFFAQMQNSMRAQGGAAATAGAGVGNMFSQEMRIFDKMNGVPVSTRRFAANGKLESTADVISKWQEQSVPESQFEIPAGYTEEKVRGLTHDRD